MKLSLNPLDDPLTLIYFFFPPKLSIGLCFTLPNRFHSKAGTLFRLVFLTMPICSVLHITQAPLSNKVSYFVSMCVSLDNSKVLDKSPLSGPGRNPHSCNRGTKGLLYLGGPCRVLLGFTSKGRTGLGRGATSWKA